MPETIHVVAGVLADGKGRYLLSSRPMDKAYAGYWEFAGGKVEPGETEIEALKREFAEELDIEIRYAVPWLAKVHLYEHAKVHLRFFRVPSDGWFGTIRPREGQQWAWQQPGHYTVSPMLPANISLLTALAVPNRLSGGLKTGFSGLDDNGSEYRLLPYDLAGNVRDECVFLDFAALQRLGRRPENAAVWAVVENTAQFVQVQDCDGVIWQIADRHSAEALSALLVQGVSLPVAAYAPRDCLRHYVQSWLDLGLHVQIENREYEMV